jgi:hypothetical protein
MAALFASSCLGATALWAPAVLAAPADIKVDADDIGGVVTSAKGPEAGVWVIAETKGLPTNYIKIVVTDDAGRYVLPDLPKAKYKVWVRGYGLVDSKPVESEPGKTVNLSATVAPDAKAAAEYYPAAWWYAMLKPPAPSEFPGTGAKGNGIAPAMVTQDHWLQNMKENCMFCHQLGDKATRELEASDHKEGWANRIQMARPDGDPVIGDRGKEFAATMGNNMTRFGRDRGIGMFADWTQRIAKGEVPKVAPPRPTGVERNIVVTVRDWGGGHYIHDQISSDHRDPTVNAGGPVYGMGTLGGYLEVLDPKTLKITSLPIPSVDGKEAHDKNGQVHADEMDAKGRVWMASIYRDGPDQAWCRDGSVPSSKLFPLPPYKKGATLPMYDPKTGKIEVIPLCVGGNHSNFTFDKESILYMSGDTNVVAWLNTKVWDETHDIKKAHGWCPMVLDTNGDGKIDQDHTKWNVKKVALFAAGGEGASNAKGAGSDRGHDDMDPKKDTLITAYLYGMSVAKDGSVWEAAYVPYVPSGIVHMIPGNNPPETCKTEYFEPPKGKDGRYPAVGVRGVGVDADGVAWAAFSSGAVGSFDRRKCKVTNGPEATGQHCPEGWTFYDLPAPKVGDSTATSDFVYSEWNDWKGVMGLGENARFFPAVNSDSILAMPYNKPGQFTVFRVPYPMGFYTRGLDFRIDDNSGSWKSKTMQATYASGAPWHQEDGEGSNSKLVTFQMRPDPLAH